MLSRRHFLSLSAAAALGFPSASAASSEFNAFPMPESWEQRKEKKPEARLSTSARPRKVDPGTKRLRLRNAHVPETIDIVYWENGAAVPGAKRTIDRFCRDWRTGEVKFIDWRTIDIAAELCKQFGEGELVSGYRCPATNAMLRREGRGVAKNSLHISGMAMDLRFHTASPRQVSKAAQRLGRGGVGTYNKSDFTHVDSGKVRQWVG